MQFTQHSHSRSEKKSIRSVLALALLFIGVIWLPEQKSDASTLAGDICNNPFHSISTPLSDLGADEYISWTTGEPTGHFGGLYPDGTNSRPPEHEAAGVAIGEQIQPLNMSGAPDPGNGKIVLVSVGMSNTSQEFEAFQQLVDGNYQMNPQIVLVNGSRGSLVSSRWADPNDNAWPSLDERLEAAGVTPQQVQIAWVKLAQFGYGDFPEKPESLQADLENVARILKARYPSIKIAYFSSRTRSYVYETGLSPEPTAFETAFSVRWMIEKQINGDPTLNFDPAKGPVVAPYLSWGPYLWIDGENERSDGRDWTQEDLEGDCTHPSASGEQKVAEQLFEFLESDSTSSEWFLWENSCQDRQTIVAHPHDFANNPLGSAANTCVYLPLLHQ